MSNHRNFDLVKAIIKNDSVFVEFTDWIDGDNEETIVDTRTINRPLTPHADLIDIRDTFKEYLMRSQGHYDIFDEAIKYLKGEKKQNVVDKFNAIKNDINITEIHITGKNDLKGVVIKGTIKSWKQNKVIKTPKIIFSGEEIGIETNVQGQCELLEEEIKEFLFHNKKGIKELFDKEPNERGVEEPESDNNEKVEDPDFQVGKPEVAPMEKVG